MVRPTFHMSGLFSKVDLDFGLSPRDATAADAVLDADGVWRGNFGDFQIRRDSEVFKLDGAASFEHWGADRELRFGASSRKFDTAFRETWGERQLIHLARENFGTDFDLLEARREAHTEASLQYRALWLQASSKLPRLTFDLGLRYDVQRGRTAPLLAAANPVFPELLPELRTPSSEPRFVWRLWSPRVGVAYSAGPEGRTLLRASLSRFSSQLNASAIERTSPSYSATALFGFEDLNGNGQHDADEALQLIDASGFDPQKPHTLTSPNSADPDLEPEITDELFLGIDHRLRADLTLGLQLTWRQVHNILEQRILVRDGAGSVRSAERSDYVLDSTFIGTLPSGRAFFRPVYSLDPSLSYTGGSLLLNGDREQTYQGVTATVVKRPDERSTLRGQVTFSDWQWQIGSEFRRFDDPTDSAPYGSGVSADSHEDIVAEQVQPFGENQDFFLNSTWSFDLSGSYLVAQERPWAFTLAGRVSGRQGFPVPYFVTVTPPDGRTRNLQATERTDSVRHSDLYQVDLRLEKEVELARLGTTFSLDVFNLLDSTVVLQRSRQLNAPQAAFVRESLSPRVLRLGVRFAWE